MWPFLQNTKWEAVEHCHVSYGKEIRMSSHCTVAASVTTDDPAGTDTWAQGKTDWYWYQYWYICVPYMGTGENGFRKTKYSAPLTFFSNQVASSLAEYGSSGPQAQSVTRGEAQISLEVNIKNKT